MTVIIIKAAERAFSPGLLAPKALFSILFGILTHKQNKQTKHSVLLHPYPVTQVLEHLTCVGGEDTVS